MSKATAKPKHPFDRPMLRADKRKWLEALFAQHKPKPGERAIIIALVHHYHNDLTGQCNPKQETLAAFVDCSPDHVQRTLARFSFAIQAMRETDARGYAAGKRYRLVPIADWIQVVPLASNPTPGSGPADANPTPGSGSNPTPGSGPDPTPGPGQEGEGERVKRKETFGNSIPSPDGEGAAGGFASLTRPAEIGESSGERLPTFPPVRPEAPPAGHLSARAPFAGPAELSAWLDRQAEGGPSFGRKTIVVNRRLFPLE